jgi:hypothetical protein
MTTRATISRLVLVVVLVLVVAPAAARPRLEPAARAGRVTVLAEPGLEGLATDLAERAEDVMTRISADLAGLPTPPRIEVRLVRESTALAAVAPAGRGAPPWAVGVAYPDLGIVSIAIRKGAHFVEPTATLRHELAHLALGAALGPRAPRWLHEGFAYQHSAEWSREREETLAGMAWFGTITPLEELEHSFPREELVAHRAYAQSYDFVGFLSRRGRWEDRDDDGDRYPFRRFLREVAHGATLDAAATHAYGRPLRALFEEWKADLEHRHRFFPIGLLALGLWVVAALLLIVAYLRRRRQNRARIAQWDLEDAARREREDAAGRLVIAPPYVPWPGEDPFEDDPEDRPGPRVMN